MAEERAKRKLSGILSADAAGYSRLMQEDEASTIRTLEESKRLMSELIEQLKRVYYFNKRIAKLLVEADMLEEHPSAADEAAAA